MDSKALVLYSVNETVIAQLRESCASLACDTPTGYESVRVAIGRIRTARTAIEKERVEQKADALAFGRFVDSEAKRFTDLLIEIENPLKAKKKVIDDEADRVRREKEAAALKLVQDEIDRNLAIKAAAEQAIKDAEAAAIAAEREALRLERERLATEQAKIDAARKAEEDRAAAARKVEQAKIDAERAKVDADRRAVEVERQKAEQLARDVIEKARRDAELAALAPDLVKVEAFVAAIRALQAPKMKSKKLSEIVAGTMTALAHVAHALTANISATKGGR